MRQKPLVHWECLLSLYSLRPSVRWAVPSQRCWPCVLCISLMKDLWKWGSVKRWPDLPESTSWITDSLNPDCFPCVPWVPVSPILEESQFPQLSFKSQCVSPCVCACACPCVHMWAHMYIQAAPTHLQSHASWVNTQIHPILNEMSIHLLHI